MGATPDVTVIIPVYNTRPYLAACLDSLIAQTIGHDRLEVMAVDDGSTDGSGELLDEYAASYPDVVRVHHQPNSGGPAAPCNAGLDRAKGRFVFFLGSDDYLATDALERLVDRADAWEADVVVPVMEGVNGRHVDQRLFEEECSDLAFPGDLLPFAISNTKLFRRRLVEEHALRYPLDLRVGSDQPFTVAAMAAARRIGVLERPTGYFAVKRDDEANISYSTAWRTRLQDIAAVVDHLCAVLPPGDDRDALLVRHFTWEFDKLLTRDLAEVDGDTDARELVAALGEVAGRLFTDGVRRRLTITRRLRWHHVMAGDLDALRAVLADTPPQGALVVDAHGLFLATAGFRDGVPDWVYAVPEVNVATRVAGIDRESQVRIDGTRIVLTGHTDRVDPRSAAQAQLALSPTNDDGVPRRALDVPRAEGTRVLATGPVTIGPDGVVRAEVDVTPLLEAGGGRAGLRLRLVTDDGDRIIDRPVRAVVDETTGLAAPGWRGTVTLTSSNQDRVLVEVDAERTLGGRIRGRLGR